MSEKFEFRTVFNADVIKYIAKNIAQTYPPFKENDFMKECLEDFSELSFGDRSNKITTTLYNYLPKDYKTALGILTASLGEEIQVEELEGYDGFYIMPLCGYIAKYGIKYINDDPLFYLSLEAQVEMTKRFSAEYSIRYFLKERENDTLEFLKNLTSSENCHVRRLVSEGTRPRLPLSIRLHSFVKNPQKILELLDMLKNEPTRLVQRSIANNLNDIAKDNPDSVAQFLSKWKSEGVKDIDWIISHATRSLVKEGHLPTLELLGYKSDLQLSIKNFYLQEKNITLGESLEFSFDIELLEGREKVVIDYILYFKKANGALKPKVFKLKNTFLEKEKTLHITKKHPLKFATTRKYYEGTQAIELQINGKLVSQQLKFHLKVD